MQNYSGYDSVALKEIPSEEAQQALSMGMQQKIHSQQVFGQFLPCLIKKKKKKKKKKKTTTTTTTKKKKKKKKKIHV